ncbi:MAG: polysaccharide biosynthesis protein [Pirellulales bacterium]
MNLSIHREPPADGAKALSSRGHLLNYLRRNRKALVCTAALLPMFIGIYHLSFWLRFDGQLGPHEIDSLLLTVAWVVLIKLTTFWWFQVSDGWGRFVTFHDLVVLLQAATASLLPMLLIDRFLLPSPTVPRSVFLLDWGTTILVLGGMRALWRGFRECSWGSFMPSDQIPTFIVGANNTGESLLRAIIQNGKRKYRVIGFIDDDAESQGTRIGGVPVIGTLQQTCPLALRHGVQELLIAKEELSGRQIRQLMDEASRHGLRVKVLPSFEQLISGNVTLQPRAVSIDDLLQREPVDLDIANIREWIDGRVLMVTGSAGSIGSEVCRQLLQFSPERLVLVDRSESGQFFLERELRAMAGDVEIEVAMADLLDANRMRNVLQQHRPQVIFHAAAYKHVPLMEANPGEAVKNIVLATRRLADLAIDAKVESFVMISTDKAVNPTSVMGACKRVAGLYVQALSEQSACRFVTVRFGNVLDSAGSVVPVFRQQIAQGGPVTVTHPDIERYFMTIPEAARLVIQAGAIGKGGEILVLDMGDPVRIVDLAADMIRLSGLKVGEDIAIEFTGLRPGEKLYEELHLAGEKPLPTCHPKITVVGHDACKLDFVVAAMDELAYLADECPEMIFECLGKIVPEYRGERLGRLVRRAA